MLLEFLLQAFLEPFLTLLLEKPLENVELSMRKSRLPKWVRILLAVLLVVMFIGTALIIVCGAIFVAMLDNDKEIMIGIIMLAVGLALFVAYIVFIIIRQYLKKRRERNCTPKTFE